MLRSTPAFCHRIVLPVSSLHIGRLALLCALVSLGSKAALAAPLAVLSDVKGQVQVVHGASTQVGKSGSLLEAGDFVQVINGSATIFYASRAPQVVKTGQKVQLSAAKTSKDKPAVWGSVFTGLSSGFARRPQSRPLTTPVRGNFDYTPGLLIPVGLIRGLNPTFAWVAPFPRLNFEVKEYQLTLLDETGETYWQVTTPKTFVVYPESAPPLRVGTTYSWYVTPRGFSKVAEQNNSTLQTDESIKSKKYTFTLAKAEDRIASQREVVRLQLELKDAEPTLRRLAIASMLHERGFNTAALATLKPATYDPASPAASVAIPSAAGVPPEGDPIEEATKVLLEDIRAEMKK